GRAGVDGEELLLARVDRRRDVGEEVDAEVGRDDLVRLAAVAEVAVAAATAAAEWSQEKDHPAEAVSHGAKYGTRLDDVHLNVPFTMRLSSVVSKGFSRKRLPAARKSLARLVKAPPVRKITRSACSGATWPTASKSSMPPISGMRMSMRTTSQR